MSCGCKTPAARVDRAVSRSGMFSRPLPILQTVVGMCASCRYVPDDMGVSKPCPKAHRLLPLSESVRRSWITCELGRWPDAEGVVTWRGRRWFGVPDPLRWRVMFRLGREGALPGCGCDVENKAGRWGKWLSPWMEISGELRAVVARAMQGWRDMIHQAQGARTWR